MSEFEKYVKEQMLVLCMLSRDVRGVDPFVNATERIENELIAKYNKKQTDHEDFRIEVNQILEKIGEDLGSMTHDQTEFPYSQIMDLLRFVQDTEKRIEEETRR